MRSARMSEEKQHKLIEMGSPEEVVLVDELCAFHAEEMRENPRLVKFVAECCLRNRHHDMPSASKRLGKYLAWRKESFGDLNDHSIQNDLLQSQISGGYMSILSEKLPDGTTLLFVRQRCHEPSYFDAKQTLHYYHYMIMSSLMRDPSLARNGFVIVNNFAGAGLANTDISASSAIAIATSKCMPVRVVNMVAVNAPWVLNLLVPIMRSLLSTKLGMRFNTSNTADLPNILSVPVSHLPVELGGEVTVTPAEDVLKRLLDENLIV